MLPAEHHGACWELLSAAARDVLACRQGEALGGHRGDCVGQRDRSLVHLLVEINHERALLGDWVQHSGAPAGRSRGSALLYGEVCWSGRQLLGGEALILGRQAGQGALVAGAAPQRGGPSSTDGGCSFTEHGRSQRSTTHWVRKTAQGPGPTAPGPCASPG